MAFDSRVYRILIASPGDVDEERDIVVRVIQEWNDLHSYTRKVVLLPLRWETHTAPEYGTRPQEVINRAIVDQCDVLVGVFWTRIGTPTGVADSGTLEEIVRVAKAGKPVMLYFSKVGMDPDRLDLGQLKRLQAFKAETYPNALTESYKSQIEFRDKFAKQLELKVRDLQRADSRNQPPPLSLVVDSGDPNVPSGASVTRAIDVPTVSDMELMNSYAPEARKRVESQLKQVLRKALALPLTLAIANTGTSGIRNLYVELLVVALEGAIETLDSLTEQESWLTRVFSSFVARPSRPAIAKQRGTAFERDEADEGLVKTADGWKLTFEWDALQPQRVRLVRPGLVIRLDRDSKIALSAKIFADSFPEPYLVSAELVVVTRARPVHLGEALPNWKQLAEMQSESHDTGSAATS